MVLDIVHNKTCTSRNKVKIRTLMCHACKLTFHSRCFKFSKNKRNYIDKNKWYCNKCAPPIKSKCSFCKKKIHLSNLNHQCKLCKKFYHKKCQPLCGNSSLICNSCTIKEMPFTGIDDNLLGLTVKGTKFMENSLNLSPSFTIKSLLDKFPGEIEVQTEDEISGMTSSQYYTPHEFTQAKFSKTCLSIFHINIVSLQKNIDELRNLLDILHYPFDIIAVTETKLKNKTPIRNIDIPDYTFEHTPSETNSGGAGIYIKNCFEYETVKKLSMSLKKVAESIFVEIKNHRHKTFLVGNIYRHPSNSLHVFNRDFLTDLMTKISKSKKLCVLAGDFNADLLQIESNNHLCEFFELISSFSFKPLVLQPTRVTLTSSTLIDNIFINNLETNSKGGNITASLSDHFPQFSVIDCLEKTTKIKINKTGRSYKHFNNDEFEKELSEINWTLLFENKNTEQCFEIFFNKVEGILNVMAPIKTLTKKETDLYEKPWITTGLLKSMKNRDKIHKRFVKEKDVEIKNGLFREYKSKRNMIVKLLRITKSDYYEHLFLENKNNMKETWKNIRKIININKKSNVSPQSLLVNKTLVSDKKAMAEEFNKYFTTIGDKIEKDIPLTSNNFAHYLQNSVNESIFLNPVNEAEILDLISQMKVSKSCGPTSIPNKLLKLFGSKLAHPLQHVINLSFCTGHFPDLLKLANVIPLYKKDEKIRCSNYRPISLLSNISKLFEKAMHVRLYAFLEKYNVLYNHQYGFRKKHSTQHALVKIIEHIKEKIDNKTIVAGVFLDLQKAFDTVNHKILLQKLEHYGIRGQANKLLKSYLSSRYQRVSLDGCYSNYQEITCGVPQGSILGPLLFVIYINDMHNAVKHSFLCHFADDTNLTCDDKESNKLKKKLNEDIRNIFTWLCANRLSLNASKTEFIIFKPVKMRLEKRIKLNINGTKIFESNKMKYLGLIVDRKLTWKLHLYELRKKLGVTLGILNQLKKHKVPINSLISIYYSLFQSYLSYGIALWGYANEVNFSKIKVLQNKAIRIIKGLDYHASTNSTYKELKILKVEDLRTHYLSNLMWEFDNGDLPTSFNTLFNYVKNNHNRDLRSSKQNKLSENVKINTEKYGRTSIRYQGPKIFNNMKSLPFYNNAKSRKNFSKCMKQHLIDQY